MKFEYRWACAQSDRGKTETTVQALNDLASNGWRVVPGVLVYRSPGSEYGTSAMVLMERRVQDPSKHWVPA